MTADADDEARQLTVALVADPKREADQSEDEAGEGNREFLMDLEELVVRGDAFALELGGADPELRNRHLAGAERGSFAWKDRLLIEAKQQLVELKDLVLVRGNRGVARAVLEDHLERSLVAIDDNASLARQVNGGRLPRTVLRHEHAGPSAP